MEPSHPKVMAMQCLREILPVLASGGGETLPPELAAALAWQAAAGAELAARAVCTGCGGGALWLRAEDAAAQAHIASITPELLRRLPGSLGVRRLEFLP